MSMVLIMELWTLPYPNIFLHNLSTASMGTSFPWVTQSLTSQTFLFILPFYLSLNWVLPHPWRKQFILLQGRLLTYMLQGQGGGRCHLILQHIISPPHSCKPALSGHAAHAEESILPCCCYLSILLAASPIYWALRHLDHHFLLPQVCPSGRLTLIFNSLASHFLGLLIISNLHFNSISILWNVPFHGTEHHGNLKFKHVTFRPHQVFHLFEIISLISFSDIHSSSWALRPPDPTISKPIIPAFVSYSI